MKVEIYTLIENEEGKMGLKNEFGLSFLIRDGEKSFIFDTGQTGKFIENGKKMGFNLKAIKDIVLSHSHYDHTGGLKTFIENISKDFTLHVNKSFFQEKHRIKKDIHEFIGNNFDEEYLKSNKIPINYINQNTYKITENITLHTNFSFINDFEIPVPYYFRKTDEGFILDEMRDEVVLAINAEEGLYIICGCSHIGIVNIIENIKRRTNRRVCGVIGGLHLSKADDKRMEKVLNYFTENKIEHFAICHCTGTKLIEKIEEISKKDGLKREIVCNHTGNKITIDITKGQE